MHQALNTDPRILALAAQLDEAAHSAQAIPQITDTAALSLPEAYAVRDAAFARRLARGEGIAGIKMGFTSRAKMAQMGVSDLIWGRLSAAMRLPADGELALSRFIHPRAEPEVAFRLAKPLEGNVSRAEAMAAVDGVACAIEVIDSRYRDFRFSLADVVADNASSAAFLTGDWHPPRVLENLDFEIALYLDGQCRESGRPEAILGDPWQSLVEAARLAAAGGIRLEAGWTVLAGAATAAVALAPGMQVEVRAGPLGRAGFRVSAHREGSA